MNHQPATSLKLVYCLVLLAATLPLGLAKAGWVLLATGGAGIGFVPFLGPLVLLCLGLYRVYLVVGVPGVLDSPQAAGIPNLLRVAGAFCLYLGAVASILSWTARPLMRAFMTGGSESGAEYFVVGIYLSLAAGIGTLGLLFFESGRLLAFERGAHQGRA